MSNSYLDSKEKWSTFSVIIFAIIIFWNIFLLVSCIIGTEYCKEVAEREQEDEDRGKPTSRYDLY